ncbi:MAG TPA: hypothetical protein VK204_15390, partial [Nocardioidaceae bacterium]|nr:hypothetical protein [Nocardioidaceae bacterium]
MDATPAPLTAADLARFDALAEEQRRPLPGQVALFDLPRHDAPTEPDARALMVFGGGKRRNARREILAEKVRGVWKARKDHEPIDVWCPACG